MIIDSEITLPSIKNPLRRKSFESCIFLLSSFVYNNRDANSLFGKKKLNGVLKMINFSILMLNETFTLIACHLVFENCHNQNYLIYVLVLPRLLTF